MGFKSQNVLIFYKKNRKCTQCFRKADKLLHPMLSIACVSLHFCHVRGKKNVQVEINAIVKKIKYYLDRNTIIQSHTTGRQDYQQSWTTFQVNENTELFNSVLSLNKQLQHIHCCQNYLHLNTKSWQCCIYVQYTQKLLLGMGTDPHQSLGWNLPSLEPEQGNYKLGFCLQ